VTAKGSTEIWVPSAAVRSQHRGPHCFEVVDEHPGSEHEGFYRGFSTSFRLRAGADGWFHFPFATPSLIAGAEQALYRLSLLWETDGTARIAWVTMHHGGQTRIELSPRDAAIQGELRAVPGDPRWPAMAMRRSDWPVEPALPVSMGVQLCVWVRTDAQAPGSVRFYGAGASFRACSTN
jgi:hypothetical protein